MIYRGPSFLFWLPPPPTLIPIVSLTGDTQTEKEKKLADGREEPNHTTAKRGGKKGT